MSWILGGRPDSCTEGDGTQRETSDCSLTTVARPFTAGDVDFAVVQSIREGWTTTRGWFKVFLAHDPGGCFVLEVEGVPTGMVTTTCYEQTGWIGYLIVSPDHRHRGFGTCLMTCALDHVAAVGIATVRLDADPPGMNIYRRLGFVDEYESLRFSLGAARECRPTSAIPLTLERLDAVARLDRAAFGDDRARLLRLLVSHAEAGFVVVRDGPVVGYVVVIQTTTGVHVGPCVAESSDIAMELWSAALGAARGRSVTAGIPASNRAGTELLRSLGFTPTPSSTRMVRGPVTAAGMVGSVFAIGSGAFG